jgi:hypothetical protein
MIAEAKQMKRKKKKKKRKTKSPERSKKRHKSWSICSSQISRRLMNFL